MTLGNGHNQPNPNLQGESWKTHLSLNLLVTGSSLAKARGNFCMIHTELIPKQRRVEIMASGHGIKWKLSRSEHCL